jgi:Zn-dependent alcohol dehydrogenase
MAAELPKTYKAVVLEKPGDPFVLRDVPLEHPKEGEILIKVHACGVCHSDSFLQQGLFGPL